MSGCATQVGQKATRVGQKACQTLVSEVLTGGQELLRLSFSETKRLVSLLRYSKAVA